MKRTSLVVAFASLLFILGCQPAPPGKSISGIVVDEANNPIPGAVVRIKATDYSITTALDGIFEFTNINRGQPVFITAWASGYYINGVDDLLPGATGVEIILHAHPNTDNTDYAWLPSSSHAGQGENQGCAQCHSSSGANPTFSLPVDEWLLDAHSQSAVNPRFLTMYLGTDVDGNQSPLTRFAFNRDYGTFPQRPDLTQPYYGPGYKLDFPDTAGNCAACHTPAAAVNDAYNIDPSVVSGVAAEGIPCDFCHKVWDSRLNQSTNLPFPNMPGVMSYEFRRPPEGHQFFAGPFDDVAPGEDTYSPVQRQSQFCAPCHFGVFWGTQVYNSFGEWLESPYSNAETGRTCQDCHMPPSGSTHFALPEKDGVERDPQTIFSHRMPGATDETLLQNAVSMEVSARCEESQIIVEVAIVNDQTGHHIPTDSPLRQMILLVSATDGQGQSLVLQNGPTVPEWGGVGDSAQGYYAGLPGKGFAKILMELWTEVTPTAAYWNPTLVVSDNRLAAFESDTSTYTFERPPSGEASVQVTLLFRRAFKELMIQKGWAADDILMKEVLIRVPSTYECRHDLEHGLHGGSD